MRDAWWALTDALTDRRDDAERWLFGERRAELAVALARIGLGLCVLGILATNVGDRSLWVGQASVWAEPVRDVSTFPELVLMRDASDDVVTVVYLVTMLAAGALTLGWRTWAANVVTLVGFIAIVGQNPMVGEASDNAVRLSLLWLLLTRSGSRLSLDRRRDDRDRERGDDEPGRRFDDVVPLWLSTSLHNLGVLGLAVQTILLYTSAGLDKVARSAWRSGEALYYTTQLPEFRPFPVLSDAVSSSEVILAALTYLVLFAQLFFGPLLLHRATRILVVLVAIASNLFFAIVFGAVASAVAVVSVTVIFLPEDLLERWGTALTGGGPVRDWVADRAYDVSDRAASARWAVSDFVRHTVLRR